MGHDPACRCRACFFDQHVPHDHCVCPWCREQRQRLDFAGLVMGLTLVGFAWLGFGGLVFLVLGAAIGALP